jgi:hypothetical protein
MIKIKLSHYSYDKKQDKIVEDKPKKLKEIKNDANKRIPKGNI